MPLIPPARCLYFVPGNEPDRLRAVPEHRPDAVVIDLEASVPPLEVPKALTALGDHVAELRDAGQRLITVRCREVVDGGLDDVETAATAAVDAVVVPKANPVDLPRAQALLDELGAATSLVPILETPEVIAESLRLLHSSSRIDGVIGGSGTRNGDLHRTLGFEWTEQGTESLLVRSQILLHARAAGLDHIIGAGWSNVADLDGLRRHARSYRALGYTGYVAVHPDQIGPVQEVFTPDAEEIDYARRVLRQAGRAEGAAA